MLLVGGCQFRKKEQFKFACDGPDPYKAVATEIEYPETCVPENPDVAQTLPPRTLLRPARKNTGICRLKKPLRSRSLIAR